MTLEREDFKVGIRVLARCGLTGEVKYNNKFSFIVEYFDTNYFTIEYLYSMNGRMIRDTESMYDIMSLVANKIKPEPVKAYITVYADPQDYTLKNARMSVDDFFVTISNREESVSVPKSRVKAVFIKE